LNLDSGVLDVFLGGSKIGTKTGLAGKSLRPCLGIYHDGGVVHLSII